MDIHSQYPTKMGSQNAAYLTMAYCFILPQNGTTSFPCLLSFLLTHNDSEQSPRQMPWPQLYLPIPSGTKNPASGLESLAPGSLPPGLPAPELRISVGTAVPPALPGQPAGHILPDAAPDPPAGSPSPETGSSALPEHVSGSPMPSGYGSGT